MVDYERYDFVPKREPERWDVQVAWNTPDPAPFVIAFAGLVMVCTVLTLT